MSNALTTKQRWEGVWSGVQLPTIAKPTDDLQRQLETHLPRDGTQSLIEIGCAPGRWMAYFSKHFGYRVAGLEYAEAAAGLTRQNLELQAIDAAVLVQDFFADDCAPGQHDVVFSAGFIEHFRDIAPVVKRLCALSRKYVVTIVPNVAGVNGLISRTFRPEVYHEHTAIDRLQLETLHAACGMRTLFCDYVGGMNLIMPTTHTEFFRRHRHWAWTVDAPIRLVNRLSSGLSRATAYTPRSRLVSSMLMYMGRL